MAKTFKTRPQEKQAEVLRELHDDPIFIPHDPPSSEETPLPSDNGAWPGFILISGSIVALLCAWWFAPAQVQALWGTMLNFFFH